MRKPVADADSWSERHSGSPVLQSGKANFIFISAEDAIPTFLLQAESFGNGQGIGWPERVVVGSSDHSFWPGRALGKEPTRLLVPQGMLLQPVII